MYRHRYGFDGLGHSFVAMRERDGPMLTMDNQFLIKTKAAFIKRGSVQFQAVPDTSTSSSLIIHPLIFHCQNSLFLSPAPSTSIGITFCRAILSFCRTFMYYACAYGVASWEIMLVRLVVVAFVNEVDEWATVTSNRLNYGKFRLNT